MTGTELHHVICILHVNERPFKHLCVTKGITETGPKSCGGAIGDPIADDEGLLSRPVKDFTPMAGPLPNLSASELKDLSSDQLYLYEMLRAIQLGQKAFLDNPNLQWRSPGCLNHARWLTRANRILRYQT